MGSDIVQRQQAMQDKIPGDEGAEYVGMEEILEDQKICAWVTYEVQPTRTLANRARGIRFYPNG